MTPIDGLLSHPLLERLGWTLLHFLWQGALAALVLAMALAMLRRAGANARYLAAGAALLALALAPLVTFSVLGFGAPAGGSIPAVSGVASDGSPGFMDALNPGPLKSWTSLGSGNEREANPAGDGAEAPTLSQYAFRMPHASVPGPREMGLRVRGWLARHTEWLALAWLCGVALLSLRLAGGFWRMRRLTRNRVRPVTGLWQARLEELARRLGFSARRWGRRPVRLLASAVAAAPLALGWVRPVILLPVSALTGLAPEALEALLAHELAHIRRHDYLVNLLQTVVETILFYHPAVWWVSRRMRIEREFCCDDLAARACGNAVVYARALAAMETLRAAVPQTALGARGGGPLLERVTRLVSPPATPRHPGRSWLAGVLVLALLAALGALTQLSSRAASGGASPKANATLNPAPAPAPMLNPTPTPAPTGKIKLKLSLRDARDKPVRDAAVEFLRRQGPDWRPDPQSWGVEPEAGVYWRDHQTGEVWSCVLSTGGRDGETFTWDLKPGNSFALTPGVYRVLAHEKFNPKPGDPFGALGLSEPVRLEAGHATSTTVRLAAGSPLALRIVDSLTSQPLQYAWLRLRRADGLPIGPGSRNFTLGTDERGLSQFAALPPGDYTLTAGHRLNQFGQPQYQTRTEVPVRIAADRPSTQTVALARATLDAAEIEKRWPFIVEGWVTGADGKPLPGVKLDAHGGMATLMPVGSAVTGVDGHYLLRFGPGRLSSGPDAEIPLQAATIYAHQDGFYEQNLCRGGGLGMAGKLPEGNVTWPAARDQILLPGKPYRLDFVMLPAARVAGLLADRNGKPLAGQRLTVNGPTGPSASVLANVTTDAEGKFVLDEVPCRPYAFAWRRKKLPDGWSEIRSEALDFARPGDYSIELTDDGSSDRLAARVVKSSHAGAPGAPTPAPAPAPQSGTESSPTLNVLLDALPKEKSADTRKVMLRALGQFHDPRAIAMLEKYLDSDFYFEIWPAFQSLKALGWKPHTLGQRFRMGEVTETELPQATRLAGRSVLEGAFSLDAPTHFVLEQNLEDTSHTHAKLEGWVDFRRQGDRLRARFEASVSFPGSPQPEWTSWAATFEFLDREGKPRARHAGVLSPHVIPRLSDLPDSTEGHFVIELGELKNPEEIQRFRLTLTYLPGMPADPMVRYYPTVFPAAVREAYSKADELQRARMIMNSPATGSREYAIVPLEPPAPATPTPTPKATPAPPSAPGRVYVQGDLQFEAGFMPDKKEALLGEEVMVSFFVKNTGTRPFNLQVGGDGRGMRPTHVQFSAVDGAGNKVIDPNANAMNSGGLWAPATIQPGQGYAEQVPLSKWCEFTAPGVYTVTGRGTLALAEKADVFYGVDKQKEIRRPAIATSFTLTLREPTPEEARLIIEARKADNGLYQQNSGLGSLHAPVYLPLLLADARGGDLTSLKAVGGIITPEATRALLDLAREELDAGKPEPALAALDQVLPRLPNPNYYRDGPTTGTLDTWYAADRLRVERSWRPDLAEPARALARRLAGAADQHSLMLAGRILGAIGTAQDLPAALAGYTHAIEATKTLPFETQQYFRPRGAAYVYRGVIPALYERGGPIPSNPATPGEAAAWLIAMQTRKDFRPPDWPQTALRWLGNGIPYMKELVLDYLPEPPPEAVLARLPEWLSDSYVDLQIAACKLAQKHPRAAYREPLLKILRTGKEHYLLDFATQAAAPNGILADQVMELWLGRMEPGDLGKDALLRLMLAALDGTEQSTRELTPEALAAARTRWRRFIDENRDKLRQGRKFKPGDPELAPDLFPPGFVFYFDNKPWPPQAQP